MSQQSEGFVDIYGIFKRHLNPCRRTVNGRQFYIRCKYCGDSLKAGSAHMYVRTTPPFPYYCQKCGTAGVVDFDFLKDFGVVDKDLTIGIAKSREQFRKAPKPHGRAASKRRMLVPAVGSESAFKIQYINDRLGISLTKKDLVDFGIVASVRDFIDLNGLAHPADRRIDRVVTELEESCVGFLSWDGTNINFRNVTKKKLSFDRYYCYCHSDTPEMKRFYAIRGDIDITSPKFEVVMTEGPLDLIGVFVGVYGKEARKDRVFVSVSGKGYNLLLKTLERMGMFPMDLNVYSDSDVGLDYYRRMKSSDPFLRFGRMKVHYNLGGDGPKRDFGVPAGSIRVATKEI